MWVSRQVNIGSMPSGTLLSVKVEVSLLNDPLVNASVQHHHHDHQHQDVQFLPIQQFEHQLQPLSLILSDHFRAFCHSCSLWARAGDNVIVYPQFLTCEYRVFKRGYQHSHTRVSQILYAAWRVLSYGIHYIIEDQHSTFIFMNFDICLSSSPGTSLPSVPPPEASCLRTSCTPECLESYFLFSVILQASMLCV